MIYDWIVTQFILIAESQPAVRAALRLLIEQQSGLVIAGESLDATSLLRAILGLPAGIVLFDWNLPGLPPSQTLRLVRHEQPALKIICLSGRMEDKFPALAAGADYFVWKGEPPSVLLSLLVPAE